MSSTQENLILCIKTREISIQINVAQPFSYMMTCVDLMCDLFGLWLKKHRDEKMEKWYILPEEADTIQNIWITDLYPVKHVLHSAVII